MPFLCSTNPGMRSEEPRLQSGRCERLESQYVAGHRSSGSTPVWKSCLLRVSSAK